MVDLLDSVARELAGRYDVREELGRGAMAFVYLAGDRATGQAVAIKVLRPELTLSMEARRFHREIELLTSLHHPNILPLLASDEAGALLYYVMPFVHGETLRRRLDREGALPLDAAVAIARDIASAMDYAHARGVVHRDIKPENILLDGTRALVCDFGVARAVRASSTDPVTSSGMAVGTPDYMSPEQACEPQTIDGRSDIYALGCVLYEMLTGEPPFSGPTVQAIIARHVAQEPRPLRNLRPEVPASVEAAVRAAMAKSRNERPSTGAELVAQLEG